MASREEFNIQLPNRLINRARQLGEPGETWLRNLPEQIGRLLIDWQCHPVSLCHAGSDSVLLNVETADQAAILKVGLPGMAPVGRQAMIYRHAKGIGYPQLFEADPAGNALLMEQLGDPLTTSELSYMGRLKVQCQSLAVTWEIAPPEFGLITGEEWLNSQRQYCQSLLSTSKTTLSLDAQSVLNRVLEARAENAGLPVLVHGDCHVNNVLSCGTDTWKLIDPEGLVAEKAADLGTLVREVDEESPELVQRVCVTISELTGVDAQAIWDWGFIYRVSAGLHQSNIGNAAIGDRMLHIANRLAEK